MMNINEKKELNGNIQIEGLPQVTPAVQNGASFKDEFDKLLTSSEYAQISLLTQDFTVNQVLGLDENIEIEQFNYDTKKIENVDAMFFLNVSSNAGNMNLQLNDETSVIDASNYKTMEVSKTLGDMLVKASQNNNALRLDFDNNVTVILKVAADGRIDTTFFPRDKEVENYLKNNIDYLKSRFEVQNIAYSNISYKPYREGNQKNKRQGENSNEWCLC